MPGVPSRSLRAVVCVLVDRPPVYSRVPSMHARTHRLAALKLLGDSGIVNKDSNMVVVEVFPLKKPSEAKELFIEINSAQPLKLIDLPGAWACARINL